MTLTAGSKVHASDITRLDSSYLFSQTVYFTASGTFTKASYPGLRAVRVKVQAAGAGSGGCATNAAGNTSVSGAGGGGEYREGWILEASLTANETVTIGAVGTAGSAGNNAGGTAADSSFGSHITSKGGTGGSGGPTGTTTASSSGGAGGTGGSGGDFVVQGGDGQNGIRQSATDVVPAGGGDAMLATTKRYGSSATASGGLTGHNYGGGAAGAFAYASQTQQAGAAGGPGIVIVEIYL